MWVYGLDRAGPGQRQVAEAFASVTETCEHLGSHNAEKLNNSWICFLEGLRMTDQVETCHPDIYTIIYKINIVLLTGVWYLFVCGNTSG